MSMKYWLKKATYTDNMPEVKPGGEIVIESYDLCINNQFRKRTRYDNDTEIRYLFLAVVRNTSFILSVKTQPIQLSFAGMIWDTLSRDSVAAEET